MGRLINLGLLIVFSFCYLEWGHDNSGFLFQMEYSILTAGNKSANTFLHPFILLPLLGQVILIITLFQKKPNKVLSIIGIVLTGILVLLLFAIGILSKNIRIAIATMPFILLAILFFVRTRKVPTS